LSSSGSSDIPAYESAIPTENEPMSPAQTSEKIIQKTIEEKISMKVVERILVDAMSGIDNGEDISFVKMYISSALTILRSMS